MVAPRELLQDMGTDMVATRVCTDTDQLYTVDRGLDTQKLVV